MAQQDVTNFSYSATQPTTGGYGLTYGQTNIAGTDTINVASSSTVPGTLALGGINDAGTAATLNLNGGTIIADGAAVSLLAGSAINLQSGILISENATALGSAAVTIASGTTLEGSGTTGSLTVNGTLTPGISGPGIFTSGSLSFGANAVYNVDLDGTTAGTAYTQVVSNGEVNLNGATVNLSLGYAPNPGDSYTLIKNNSGVPMQGTFAGLPDGSLLTLGGEPFTLSYEGGSGFDVVLTQAVGTSIDLGSSDNSAVYGETVIFVADILAGGNEAAVGNITFFDGNTLLATVVVGADGNSGEGTFSTSSLAIGNHTITATYTPTADSGFLGTSEHPAIGGSRCLQRGSELLGKPIELRRSGHLQCSSLAGRYRLGRSNRDRHLLRRDRSAHDRTAHSGDRKLCDFEPCCRHPSDYSGLHWRLEFLGRNIPGCLSGGRFDHRPGNRRSGDQ